MRMLMPAGPRSATAVPDKSDARDENVYSSLVLQHTGTGQQKVFTVPQGQTIPKMNGTSTASTAAHHGSYSDLTTNLVEAGKLGNAIGDASIRGIGITIEQAAYTASTGGQRTTFGATQFEVADILSKTSFEFKIAGKRQIIGPTFLYPAGGGSSGSISTTGNAATVALASNGGGWGSRRLKVPVPAARNDTLEGIFAVATGASLAFSTTTGEGQPTLVWVNLYASILGDVR